MSVKLRRVLLVGLAILIAALLYFGVRTALPWSRTPTDEDLRAKFERHLAEFEELRDILIALPQANVWFSQDQVGGNPPGNREHIAFFEYESQWHEWESRRPVVIAEILDALGVPANRYGRVMELVHRIDGGSARKTTWNWGVEVEVGVWGGAGIWGVAKMIVFLDHEPGRSVVRSTDSDTWDGTAYASLGRPGWFISASR